VLNEQAGPFARPSEQTGDANRKQRVASLIDRSAKSIGSAFAAGTDQGNTGWRLNMTLPGHRAERWKVRQRKKGRSNHAFPGRLIVGALRPCW
jgi:hypothetical protein